MKEFLLSFAPFIAYMGFFAGLIAMARIDDLKKQIEALEKKIRGY